MRRPSTRRRSKPRAACDPTAAAARDGATGKGSSMLVGSAVSAALAKAVFSFALMAAIAMATAVFIRVLVAVLGAANRRLAAQEAPTPSSPAVEQGLDPSVVAAIASAVAATVGPARIVWIGESHGAGWAAETRARHHASHATHHGH
jgi:hypothetical protein